MRPICVRMGYFPGIYQAALIGAHLHWYCWVPAGSLFNITNKINSDKRMVVLCMTIFFDSLADLYNISIFS